jgi:hypothetical protein
MVKNKELMVKNPLAQNLQVQAEQKSNEIFQKIEAANIKISDAKIFAKAANKMESGWFGKTEKKADAIAKVTVMNSEALAEINDIVQESIRFTCASIQLAQNMHKNMAYMMVKGFKDANGQITKLSSGSRIFVKRIIDDTKNYIDKQQAVEKKQYEMHKRQEEIEKKIHDQTKLTKKKDKEQTKNFHKIMDELRFYKKVTLVLSIIAVVISLGTLVFYIINK